MDHPATATIGDVAAAQPSAFLVKEHTVEIVSDSGEGAQKCGLLFGQVSARMGNGAWTVEIIPAEIEPPARSPEGASGNRIRIASRPVTNWGDTADLVVAFNEQVLLARHRLRALAPNAIVLVENMWASHEDEDIRRAWADAMAELAPTKYRLIEVPMEAQCLTLVDNPRKGKNMFALGMLVSIYGRDRDVVKDAIEFLFRKKAKDVSQRNIELMELGYRWATAHLDFSIQVPATKSERPLVVMNGNQALGLGAIASGMELCAMYPITPATSVSHYLADVFENFGGIVHQSEDEIAAAGVAIGASYAGKVAFTVTSGPGLALKTEFIGLATMAEIPLVVLDVQRGGPSTGLPTKVEQGDLLASIFGQPGDTPKVVMAAATIEECFHLVITARRIAEAFRCVVILLTDANLATGVQPFPRPDPDPRWQSDPIDLSPVPAGRRPFDWDPELGLSTRFIPGQPGGMHTLTGLSHDERSKIAYDPESHERGCAMRSRKLAVLHQALKPPVVFGDPSGDLLVVGWGSTKGAIEEAVERAREAGLRVSSLHLTFLSPMAPGIKTILEGFRRVTTVEINYSDRRGDPHVTEENRRRGQLCWLLRADTLVDVDCWTRVPGQPLRPGMIFEAIRSMVPGGQA